MCSTSSSATTSSPRSTSTAAYAADPIPTRSTPQRGTWRSPTPNPAGNSASTTFANRATRPHEEDKNVKYTKSGGQTGAGPQEWFTGTVHIDGIRNPDEQ